MIDSCDFGLEHPPLVQGFAVVAVAAAVAARFVPVTAAGAADPVADGSVAVVASEYFDPAKLAGALAHLCALMCLLERHEAVVSLGAGGNEQLYNEIPELWYSNLVQGPHQSELFLP